MAGRSVGVRRGGQVLLAVDGEAVEDVVAVVDVEHPGRGEHGGAVAPGPVLAGLRALDGDRRVGQAVAHRGQRLEVGAGAHVDGRARGGLVQRRLDRLERLALRAVVAVRPGSGRRRARPRPAPARRRAGTPAQVDRDDHQSEHRHERRPDGGVPPRRRHPAGRFLPITDHVPLPFPSISRAAARRFTRAPGNPDAGARRAGPPTRVYENAIGARPAPAARRRARRVAPATAGVRPDGARVRSRPAWSAAPGPRLGGIRSRMVTESALIAFGRPYFGPAPAL